MPRMFADIKFTAAERRAIESGWHVLSDIADRTGSTGAQYLRDALKSETGGPQAVTALFAKGLLCQWFRDSGSATLAGLYGRREASILMALLCHASAEHHNRPTQEELDVIWHAADAKEVGFKRRNGEG